ncbi:MAG: hypothetical protein IPL28_22015 [Chloroflexi bacterium]|nr:hypothetical protein [Chloroflexota bacterium]
MREQIETHQPAVAIWRNGTAAPFGERAARKIRMVCISPLRRPPAPTVCRGGIRL